MAFQLASCLSLVHTFLCWFLNTPLPPPQTHLPQSWEVFLADLTWERSGQACALQADVPGRHPQASFYWSWEEVSVHVPLDVGKSWSQPSIASLAKAQRCPQEAEPLRESIVHKGLSGERPLRGAHGSQSIKHLQSRFVSPAVLLPANTSAGEYHSANSLEESWRGLQALFTLQPGFQVARLAGNSCRMPWGGAVARLIRQPGVRRPNCQMR